MCKALHQVLFGRPNVVLVSGRAYLIFKLHKGGRKRLVPIQTAMLWEICSVFLQWLSKIRFEEGLLLTLNQ